MAPGFKIKKIKPQQTIGLILKKRRLRKKVMIEQVEEITHIRSHFIQAIEQDAWDNLPSDIYGRGYIERYAEFLGLDKKTILDKFDSERHLYKKFCFDSIEARQKKLAPLTSMWLLTPKSLAIFAGLLLFSTATGFIFWQIKSFSSAPELVILNPKSYLKKQVESDTISLEGLTSPDAQVNINGQLVNVTKTGIFRQQIGLNRGANTIVVTAKNRSQRSKAEIFTVVAQY